MPVTLAVIGLGDIARKAHLPVLATRADVTVVGLVSRSGQGAAELAAQYRFPVTAFTLDDVLQARPTAALVLSSSDSHPEIACRLLNAGVHVYVEKPMALDLEAARTMVACARENRRQLMVGFNRRYAPLYQEARRQFGDAPPATALLAKHRDEQDRFDSPAYAVWDDVIHLIDLSRWLMGEPIGVEAAVEVGSRGEFRALSALLRYPGGRSALLTQSYGAGGVTERLELHGGGRSVWVEEMETLRLLRGGVVESRQLPRWTGTLARRGFAAAMDAFLAAITGKAALLQSPEDALSSHELAQAILEADQTGA